MRPGERLPTEGGRTPLQQQRSARAHGADGRPCAAPPRKARRRAQAPCARRPESRRPHTQDRQRREPCLPTGSRESFAAALTRPSHIARLRARAPWSRTVSRCHSGTRSRSAACFASFSAASFPRSWKSDKGPRQPTAWRPLQTSGSVRASAQLGAPVQRGPWPGGPRRARAASRPREPAQRLSVRPAGLRGHRPRPCRKGPLRRHPPTSPNAPRRGCPAPSLAAARGQRRPNAAGSADQALLRVVTWRKGRRDRAPHPPSRRPRNPPHAPPRPTATSPKRTCFRAARGERPTRWIPRGPA